LGRGGATSDLSIYRCCSFTGCCWAAVQLLQFNYSDYITTDRNQKEVRKGRGILAAILEGRNLAVVRRLRTVGRHALWPVGQQISLTKLPNCSGCAEAAGNRTHGGLSLAVVNGFSEEMSWLGRIASAHKAWPSASSLAPLSSSLASPDS
jgi:hypothetical protein